MKKLIIVLSFFIVTLISSSYSYIYDADFYRSKIENNKMIEKIEDVQYLEKRIVISGIQIKGIRVHKCETNFERKTSEAVIMKDDMIEGFKRKNKDIKTINCEFKKDKMIAKGSVILMGVLMDVEMEGRVYINDEQEVIYEIKKAVVNKMITVPDSILQPFRERINPVFKLRKIEIPLYMTTVVYGEDRIILR